MSNAEQTVATTTDADTVRSKSTNGSGRSWSAVFITVALLLALSAAVVAGWAAWRTIVLQDSLGIVSNDLDKVGSVTRRLDQVDDVTRHQRQLIDDLASSLESGLRAVPELSTRISQTEQRLASIPGVAARDQSAWLIAEAAYYLQIANAQIVLAGNSVLAASALQVADDRLRDAAVPALAPVRAMLNEELAALRAMPVIDRSGMSFRLQSLAVQAGNWPFRNVVPNSFTPAITVAGTATEQSVWQRIVATLKAVFGSIVSIKETDAPPVTQLSSIEQALIVEVVKAEIQVARLALLGANTTLFTQSVEHIGVQVRQYFSSDAAAVRAALNTLRELQAIEFPGPLPDISGSLTLLQSINKAPLNPASGSASAPAVPGDAS